MLFYRVISVIPRLLIIFLIFLSLSHCDAMSNLLGGRGKTTQTTEEKTSTDLPKLTLAVAPYVAWMPWFLANEQGDFQSYSSEHQLNIQFASSNYSETIQKFIGGEVNAVAITNIDAFTQLVRQNIEADVILITSYNNGNHGIIIRSSNNETTPDVRGKQFGLVEYSTYHYLLDRYLTKNQIPFDEVGITNLKESEIRSALGGKDVYGLVTNSSFSGRMVQEQQAKVLFDSRQIPKEIIDLIVVRRETLDDHPSFAQALLAIWFSVMEKLQGNSRGPTLDAMANLAQLPREDYDRQLAATILMDTPTKALSAIRDRRPMEKTMRHIRYFIERHHLSGEEPFTEWVSYPGRDKKLLHFNGQPLQDFIAPPEATDIQN